MRLIAIRSSSKYLCTFYLLKTTENFHSLFEYRRASKHFIGISEEEGTSKKADWEQNIIVTIGDIGESKAYFAKCIRVCDRY